MQAAVIVRNNRSSLYSLAAVMNMTNVYRESQGEWVCPLSAVGANSWSVCFGRTFTYGAQVASGGSANAVGLGWSAFV
ncbi:hypothetical protein KBX06_09300 [Micromonospora sp. C31]|uniref:hypothetical protein n=1 Tax=Micromonospora sp. C31 TaxID=2824876 RepID=UPI001B383045|nr:hypothetical protein [Micromonospora sp. C31]MBQ1073356.1 hypothetical protein [Micromonospora sp. C31]